MSKDSSSRKLLGTIKFVFDKTKSRTLNATQAYDTSPSQIVLGSFPATSTKKPLTKSLEPEVPGDVPPVRTAGVASATLIVNGNEASLPPGISGDAVFKKEDLGASSPRATASVSYYMTEPVPFVRGKELGSHIIGQADTVTFDGAGDFFGDDDDDKSNAVKDIFYGAITVGTGLYRTWQGKYAVLKVDPLTNKAILRVYNE